MWISQSHKAGRANLDDEHPHGDGHFIGLRKVLGRVCKRAELEGVTPHVLRHTFASVAGDLGNSEPRLLASGTREWRLKRASWGDSLRLQCLKTRQMVALILEAEAHTAPEHDEFDLTDEHVNRLEARCTSANERCPFPPYLW